MTSVFTRLGMGLLLALAAGMGVGLGLSATGLKLPVFLRAYSGAAAAPTPEQMQRAFVQVADQVRPTVVSIATAHFLRRQRPPGTDPFSGDPSFKDFYDRYFGQMPPAERE